MFEQISMGDPDSDSGTDTRTRTPPGGHRHNVAFDSALQRHEFRCAACRSELDTGEAVFRNVWESDYSDRSSIPLCDDCSRGSREQWRHHVRERRLEDAGRARGWLIETLWPYSTATIRFVALLAIEFVHATLLAVGLVATGTVTLEAVASMVAATPLLTSVAVALAYLIHHALWVYLDPRGYRHRRRTPWVSTALAVLAGGSALASGFVFVDPLITTAAWGVAALALLWAVHDLGLAVRADRSNGVIMPDRLVAVGVPRAVALLGILTFCLSPASMVGIALMAGAFVGVAAYLAYRAPHDTRLQRRLQTIRDEIDDLLHGGPY